MREVEPGDWDLSVVVSGRPCSKCFAIGGECYTSGLIFTYLTTTSYLSIDDGV